MNYMNYLNSSNFFKSFISLTLLFISEQLYSAEYGAVETNPTKDHIKISTAWSPDLKIYDNRKLKGVPILIINEIGLWRKGKLVCKWSGVSRSDRMLFIEDEKRKKECPEKYPVRTGYSDRGLGTAVLYIEVASRHGNIAETEFEGKRCYFELNSIPEGMWEWEISEEKKIKAEKQKVAEFLTKTKFNDFLSEIRDCFRQCCIKECLPKYFRIEPYLTTPGAFYKYRSFYKYICSEEGADLLKYLESCLESSDYPEIEVASDTDVTLNGLDGYFCHIVFENGKWHIEHFLQGD